MNTGISTIEKKVIALVARTLHKNAAELHRGVKIDDIAEDSIALFGLISAFEKKFSLETEYQDLIDIETIGDIIEYLEQHLAKTGAR